MVFASHAAYSLSGDPSAILLRPFPSSSPPRPESGRLGPPHGMICSEHENHPLAV